MSWENYYYTSRYNFAMKQLNYIRGLVWCLLLFTLIPEALACTTAVISGRFTKSGRPMLWKIRDTEEYDNHMRRFESPLGYYVGLVNDSDTLGLQVWGGHNSHGFAIMNSASFNVNKGYKDDFSDQEGILMKRALAECRSLSDFEKLLDSLPRPMGLAAHFGVIDAEGGAAFYEVNNETWTKFDANEATEGYVLRTNYSFTGEENEGYGYVRFSCAANLFAPLEPKELTVQMLGSQMSRSMYHGLLGIDYRQLAEQGKLPSKSGYIDSDDLITRYGTSSMILVEGVAKGQDPELTTSWVQIGNPYLSPLVPVWTTHEIPAELQRSQEGVTTIASVAKQLKREKLYPIQTIEETRYLYMPLIYRPDGTGLSQRLEALEAEYIPMLQGTNNTTLQHQYIQQALHLQLQALTDPQR